MIGFLLHVFHVLVSNLLNVNWAPVTVNGNHGKVQFVDAAATLTSPAGECKKLQIRFISNSNRRTSSSLALEVQLLSDNPYKAVSAKTYGDSACRTSASSVTIPSGSTDAFVYIIGSRAEKLIVTASVQDKKIPGPQIQITALSPDRMTVSILTKPEDRNPNRCVKLAAIYRDRFGNRNGLPNHRVYLAASQGSFYASEMCNTTPVVSLALPLNTSNFTIFYKNTASISKPVEYSLAFIVTSPGIVGRVNLTLTPELSNVTDLIATGHGFGQIANNRYRTILIEIKNRGMKAPTLFVPSNMSITQYQWALKPDYASLEFLQATGTQTSYEPYEPSFFYFVPRNIAQNPYSRHVPDTTYNPFYTSYNWADVRRCLAIVHGQSCKLKVMFMPHAPGNYETTLNITYSTDGSNRKTLSIPLSGQALEAGSLDTFYGTNGITITPAKNASVVSKAIALDSKYRAVVAGESEGGIFLARYDSKGILDLTFGNNLDGTSGPVGKGQTVIGMAVLTDQSIVVAGSIQHGARKKFVLTRFDEYGDQKENPLHIDFGTDAEAKAMTLSPDGKLVIAGSAWNGNASDYAIARVVQTSNGLSLDSSFNGSGLQVVNLLTLKKPVFGLSASPDYAKAVLVQPDGKIVVAGITHSKKGKQKSGIIRLLPSGLLDEDFSKDGILTLKADSKHDEAVALALQPMSFDCYTGKPNYFDSQGNPLWTVVVAANSEKKGGRIVVHRLRATDGKTLSRTKVDISKYSDDSASAVATNARGDIFVTGTSLVNFFGTISSGEALIKLNADGKIEKAFLGRGKTVTDLGGVRDRGVAMVIHPVPGERLVIAGTSEDSDNISSIAISRIWP